MKPIEEHPHASASAAAAAPAAAAAAAPAAGGMMCGGIGAAKPADDDAQGVLQRITPALLEKLPRHANATPTLLSYATQVVAGRNYFLKIRLGSEVVHARVYRNLQDQLSLHSLQEGLSAEAPIAYF